MPESMIVPRTRQGVRDLDAIGGRVVPYSGGPAPTPHAGGNVGRTERTVSAVVGGLLTLFGLSRRNLAGLGLAALGGSLLYRGLSGHCHLYQALGLNTAEQPQAPAGAELVYRVPG